MLKLLGISAETHSSKTTAEPQQKQGADAGPWRLKNLLSLKKKKKHKVVTFNTYSHPKSKIKHDIEIKKSIKVMNKQSVDASQLYMTPSC